METTVTRVDRFGDYSTIQVPETETKSFYGMFLVFLGVLVCVAVLYGGAGLGNGLNLRDMAIASTHSVILRNVLCDVRISSFKVFMKKEPKR